MFDGFYDTPGLSYAEAFAYEFSLTALVYGFSALAGSYILYFIAYLIKRSIKNRNSDVKHKDDSNGGLLMDSVNELNQNLNASGTKKSNSPKAIAVKVLLVISHLAGWYALLTIAITPSILSGLGVIPVWSSCLITLTIFIIKYIGLIYTLSPHFLSKNRDQANKSFFRRFWRRVTVTTTMYKFTLGTYAVLAIIYSVCVPLMTENACMNFFNQSYGGTYQDFGLSTKFSRHIMLDTVCKKGKICHLYSTLPEDGSTGVILNVHTGVDITTLQLGYKYRDADHNTTQYLTAQSYFIDMNEDRGDRYMHSVYLSGLTPNTYYSFEINYNDETQQTGLFQTLPSPSLERNITMAAGGDVGTTQDAQEMTGVLGNYQLDTILIGGDLGYDNGIKSCYYSLDLFLGFFENLNTQAGRLIPLMVSVGNHDVGFNAFQGTQIDISNNLYFNFFPQHSTTDANGNLLYKVPDMGDRLSYAYHVVGNTLHLALDSGYVATYDGAQVDFIKNVSEKYPSLLKYANFHVPMYPTCFNPEYDDPRTLTVPREQWAPLFESYNFTGIFENHVHLYKKSFPITDGVRDDEGGVVYFGDGNWGISPDSCFTEVNGVNGNATGLLESLGDLRHVWLINMTNETLSHWAVNETNQIFDQVYNMSVSSYINTGFYDEL